jgi:hypothetical protein
MLEFLKLAPRYLVTMAIVAGFLLFANAPILQSIGVLDFEKRNRQWIGIIFILSTTLFLVDRSIPVVHFIRYRITLHNVRKGVLKRLHSLTEDEKQILRFYIQLQTKANVLRLDDGVVKGLEGHGIIWRSSSVGNMMEGFAYNIGEVAWEYLNEHKELLAGTTNTYRTDKRPDIWGY